MRPEQTFQLICTMEQAPKMKRVIDYNGGMVSEQKTDGEAIIMTVIKVGGKA